MKKELIQLVIIIVITVSITFFAVRHFFPRSVTQVQTEYVYDTSYVEVEVPVIKEIKVPSIKYVTVHDTIVEYKKVYLKEDELTPEFARSPLFTFDEERYEGLMMYYFDSGEFNFQYSRLKDVVIEKVKKKGWIGMSAIIGYNYVTTHGEFGFGLMSPKISERLELLITTSNVSGKYRFY